MTLKVNSITQRTGAIVLGLGFAGLLIRMVLVDGLFEGTQSFETIQTLLASPWWIFAGAMHVLVAAGLTSLSTGQTNNVIASLARVAAMIGAVCFLMVGISHFHLLSGIGADDNICCANGHTEVIAYNLFRMITMGSGMFALGAFLLLRCFAYSSKRTTTRIIACIAIVAGALAFSHALAPMTSGWLTVVTLVAVIAWSIGEATYRPNRDEAKR